MGGSFAAVMLLAVDDQVVTRLLVVGVFFVPLVLAGYGRPPRRAP